MDTRYLRSFLRTADLRSISRAAESLGIAQPSLSQQLLRLEDEVGFQLLASLAAIPFGRMTWLGEGHTIGGRPGSFPALGEDCFGVLLTTRPPGRFPDLSGPERRSDPIRYLWVVGIDAPTFDLVRARGSAVALAHLTERGDSFVHRARTVVASIR